MNIMMPGYDSVGKVEKTLRSIRSSNVNLHLAKNFKALLELFGTNHTADCKGIFGPILTTIPLTYL